jgi:hypothetical protein
MVEQAIVERNGAAVEEPHREEGRSWSGEIAARRLDALVRLAVVAYPA